MSKRLVIVAMGDSRRAWCEAMMNPHGTEELDADVWCINLVGTWLRCDRVIAMDCPEVLSSIYGQSVVRRHETIPVPVYMARKHRMIETSVDYPLQDVINTVVHPYLNNSVAYAIALAIHEREVAKAKGIAKYDDISFFGCDYNYIAEPSFAERGRACTEFWIRDAMARGIKIHIAASSSLMDREVGAPVFYGYEETPHVQIPGFPADWWALPKPEVQMEVQRVLLGVQQIQEQHQRAVSALSELERKGGVIPPGLLAPAAQPIAYTQTQLGAESVASASRPDIRPSASRPDIRPVPASADGIDHAALLAAQNALPAYAAAQVSQDAMARAADPARQ